MAIGILKTFSVETIEDVDAALLLAQTSTFKRNYLDLASQCECLEFISTAIVQSVNNQIWYNKWNQLKNERNVVRGNLNYEISLRIGRDNR